MRLIAPRVLVCLGATAAQALLGPKFSVMRQRGQIVRSLTGPLMTATVHPSSILRAPDDRAREQAMKLFVSDLKKVAAVLKKEPK
jgi:DNA polymerase